MFGREIDSEKGDSKCFASGREQPVSRQRQREPSQLAHVYNESGSFRAKSVKANCRCEAACRRAAF